MTDKINPTVERRARLMFENSRRGAQLFVQWVSLKPEARAPWITEAKKIEETIKAAIATTNET